MWIFQCGRRQVKPNQFLEGVAVESIVPLIFPKPYSIYSRGTVRRSADNRCLYQGSHLFGLKLPLQGIDSK